MRHRDYKEIWQDYYDEAREAGMARVPAEVWADAMTADHYAALADDAHDRAKDGDL